MTTAKYLGLARLFIGLISLGKQDRNDPSATSQFDYFRVYRP